MRFSALITFALTFFVSALGMPSQAQDANGARTKCTEFGFKENTKSHEECVKQFLNSMGSAKTAPVKKPISTPPESTSTDDQKEEDYWKEAKSVGNKEAFEAYLKFYPRGRYVGLANARLTQLSKLDSAKVENAQKPNENLKYTSCVTTISYKDWTNCVGTYSWPNGDKYIGAFKNGMRHGQGIFNYANGITYDGEFKEDKITGKGSGTFPNGNKYVGDHINGVFEGQGTFYWAKGDRYVGEYKSGKRSGQGTYIYPSGERFVGEYRDDMRNGNGTHYGPTGNVIYSGNFLNGNVAP